MKYPQQQQLKNKFNYNAGFGRLTRRFGRGARFVGYENPKSEWKILMNNQLYPAKDLIWIWHFGNIPTDKVVTRIDGNIKNDRIENLELTPAGNS